MNLYNLNKEKEISQRDYKLFSKSHRSKFTNEAQRKLKKIRELRERSLLEKGREVCLNGWLKCRASSLL